MNFTRRNFLGMLGAPAIAGPGVLLAQDSQPVISRIKYATMGATDVDAVEREYTRWLGYSVVEKSTVSEPVARSWGTPM